MDGMTITEFIEACITEREALAREADAHDWDGGKRTYYTGAEHHRDDWGVWMFHIPPKQVLAECEAKRTIVEEVWKYEYEIDGEWGDNRTIEEMQREGVVPAALRAMAAIWADHEDYDQRWNV
ncbi:MAG TPA: DUF6221 family protein [Mycobacterium sp.]